MLGVWAALEGADRVGGQLLGDKECAFSGVTKSGSLEEAAGKRCSECAEGAGRVGGQMRRDIECPFSGITNSGRTQRKFLRVRLGVKLFVVVPVLRISSAN